MSKQAPTHPGYILKTEFLDEYGLSAYALAKDLCVPVNRITTDHQGQTRDHDQHSPAAGPVFRHDAGGDRSHPAQDPT